VRCAEHELYGGKKTGKMVKTPVMRPEVKEHPPQEYVQCYADIGCLCERKDHEDPIERVEKGGLKPSEVGRSTEDEGVPQCQVPVCEFIESEVPPLKAMKWEVRIQVGEYYVPWKEKNVPKHPDYQEQQCRKFKQTDPGTA